MTTTILTLICGGLVCASGVAILVACLRIWPDEVNPDEIHQTWEDE